MDHMGTSISLRCSDETPQSPSELNPSPSFAESRQKSPVTFASRKKKNSGFRSELFAAAKAKGNNLLRRVM